MGLKYGRSPLALIYLKLYIWCYNILLFSLLGIFLSIIFSFFHNNRYEVSYRVIRISLPLPQAPRLLNEALINGIEGNFGHLLDIQVGPMEPSVQVGP